MFESNDARFAAIVSRSEPDLNLAEAALLIAADAYPALDVAAYLARLDAMAASARAGLDAAAEPLERLRALNEYLFQAEGFAGNLDDYSDPRNSFLNDVLERRLGIPISLSVLYLELGWRLGLPLEGVSFPGHFLVKLEVDDGVVVVDPFFGGISLDEAELLRRLESLLGPEAPADEYLPHLLEGTAKRDILARMLRNLKAIYAKRGEAEAGLRVLDRLLALRPGSAEEHRERGELYDGLECFQAALADYRRYLELAPEAADAERVRGRVVDLQGRAARLN